MKLVSLCLCKALSVGLAIRQQGHLLQALDTQRPVRAGVVVPKSHQYLADFLFTGLRRKYQYTCLLPAWVHFLVKHCITAPVAFYCGQ